MLVNAFAQGYGIFAIILLAKPVDADTFLDRWIVVIGAIIVSTGAAAAAVAAARRSRARS